MKWICVCKAINAEFAFECHNCGCERSNPCEVIVTDSTAGGKK